MRLVTDIDQHLDGAWIIGFVEFNDSADQILMFVCIEDPPPNTVVTWNVARGETENMYQVLYTSRWPDGRYAASVRGYTRALWEERADYDRRHFTNLIDVSECW